MKTSVQLTLGSGRKKRASGTIRIVSLHRVGTQQVRVEAISKVIGSLLLTWPQDGSKRQIWAWKVEGLAGVIRAPASESKIQPEPSQQSSTSDTACALNSDTLVAKQVRVLYAPWSHTTWNGRVWSREDRIAGLWRRQVLPAQKSPNSWKGFCKALLKARWGRGMVSYHRLTGLGILASCSCCPRRSVHFVPVNLQQDKGYCLFCNFLYELAFFFLTRGVKYIDLLFPFKYFILAS